LTDDNSLNITSTHLCQLTSSETKLLLIINRCTLLCLCQQSVNIS